MSNLVGSSSESEIDTPKTTASSTFEPAAVPLLRPVPLTLKEDVLLVVFDAECRCRNGTYDQRVQGIQIKERRTCEIGIAGVHTKSLPTFSAKSIEEAAIGDRFSSLLDPKDKRV
jgi:hypothetical protein